jgi:POT family proton-dependent oligopeptide transporter
MRTDRESHPTSFYSLALVIFFEKLAMSVVLSLLALYLREHRGYDPPTVFFSVGLFLAGCYAMSIPAGTLIDKALDPLRATLFGLGLLTVGQAGLLSDRAPLLSLSLGLMLTGSGLFRVAVMTLIGRLYPARDERLESAYGLVYAAVNLGYLAGPLGSEWIRARYGWPPIFLVAVGALLAALGILLCRYSDIARQAAHHPVSTQIADEDVGPRLRAIFFLCAIATLFWLAMQQSSTSLTFFADEHHLAPGHLASFHGLAVLLLTPLLLGAIKRLRRRGRAPSLPMTIVCGLLLSAAAFLVVSAAALYAGLRRGVLWLGATYVLISVGEVLHSAIGMSLINRLAPPRLAGRLNGLWFAAVAGGNLAAGAIGILWTQLPHHRYFALIAALLFFAALALLSRSNKLESLLRAEKI